jgi:hypothetical protein
MHSTPLEEYSSQVAPGFPPHIEIWMAGAAPLNYFATERLARVLESFASRFAPPGTIYLASGKTLSREYCPDVATGTLTIFTT